MTGAGQSASPACGKGGPAVVTDIDATLTITDGEYVQTLVDGHVAVARDGAAELFSGYADRGYWVVYVTARGADLNVPGGCDPAGPDPCVSARESTEQWLEDQGFPIERALLYLNTTTMIQPADTIAYKRGAIESLSRVGFAFEWGYGNALTDFDAYVAAGIDSGSVFSIGENAGAQGTTAVDASASPEAASYVAHIATHLDGVESVCSVSWTGASTLSDRAP